MKLPMTRTLLASAVALALPLAHADPPLDLGVGPGGTQAFATKINNLGVVIGDGDGPAPYTFYAMVWDKDGTVRHLSRYDGANNLIRSHGINNKGEMVGVVGPSPVFTPQTLPRGILWYRDSAELISLPTGHLGAIALGINDRGQVVGASGTDALTSTAYVWHKGKATNLGALPGDIRSGARAVNNNGEVVGWSHLNAAAPRKATHWAHGVVTNLGFLPGGDRAEAWDINNRGQVVGDARNAIGQTRAVLWHKGQITDLGALPGHTTSRAWGINSRGQIVGQSGPASAPTAVLWNCGKIIDLEELPGGTYSVALAINDHGQAVGFGDGAGFVAGRHALLWETTEYNCDQD